MTRLPQRTRLALFFALSCVLTWWPFAVAWLWGWDGWSVNFSIGPLLACVLVVRVTEGRAGLTEWWSRVRQVRGPVSYYMVATLVPAAIVLASAGLAVAAGAEMPPASRWLDQVLPAVLLIVPAALLFGPVGEELAFRGWAQRQLETAMTALAASLLVGMGVVVWHLPLLLRGDIPWTIVLALPAVSIVYAWLYRRSGTVWTVVALHTTQNVVSGMYVAEVFEGAAPGLRLGFLTAFYVAWAAFIVYREGPSMNGRAVRRNLEVRPSLAYPSRGSSPAA